LIFTKLALSRTVFYYDAEYSYPLNIKKYQTNGFFNRLLGTSLYPS